MVANELPVEQLDRIANAFGQDSNFQIRRIIEERNTAAASYKASIRTVDHETQKPFEYYWYCSFGDIMTLSDGTQSVKLTEVDVPRGSISFGTLYGQAFRHGGMVYVGYETLDELFYEQVTSVVADYHYVSTVK